MPAQINLEEIFLRKGRHEPGSKYCVMELASQLAGERWSDHPSSVSPTIAKYLRVWNDLLDDQPRQMLKPYASKSLNTAGTPEQEDRRSLMVLDWLVRICVPAFLRLAGLDNYAEILEKLPPIETENMPAAQSIIDAAEHAACDAAWDAVKDPISGEAVEERRITARACATKAMKAVVWAASMASPRAAWTAAVVAELAAIAAAARASAEARNVTMETMWNALWPTVECLQWSAFSLLDRMIAVTNERREA